MKNVTFLLVSLLLMVSLSSCTAEELPAKDESLQMETSNPTTPKEGETDPPPVIPLRK